MAGAGAGAASGASSGAAYGPWGAVVGGVVGAIGGAIEGAEQRAEASKQRRRFRQGVNQGQAQTQKEAYDILNSSEYRTANQFAMGTFGMAGSQSGASFDNPMSIAGNDFFAAPTGQAFSGSDKNTGKRLAHQFDDILAAQRQLESGVGKNGKPLSERDIDRLENEANPSRIDNLVKASSGLDANEANAFAQQLNKAGVDMGQFQQLRASSLGRSTNPMSSTQTLEGAGPGVVESPLTQSFRTQIGVAQNARGLYSSQSAASAEASGLAAYQYQQQQAMMPTLQKMATFGSDVYHGYEAGNIQREVQKSTGGVGAYGQANAFQNGPSAGAAAFSGGLAGGFSGASLGMSFDTMNQQQQYRQQQLAEQQRHNQATEWQGPTRW